MKDTFKLAMGILLGFFSFVAVAYVLFLAVTMVIWLMGVI
jgi:hypothetical protein